jgi:hypothetical protein
MAVSGAVHVVPVRGEPRPALRKGVYLGVDDLQFVTSGFALHFGSSLKSGDKAACSISFKLFFCKIFKNRVFGQRN